MKIVVSHDVRIGTTQDSDISYGVSDSVSDGIGVSGLLREIKVIRAAAAAHVMRSRVRR